MKKRLRRSLSIALILAMLPTVVFASAVPSPSDMQPDTLSFANENIEVVVSTKNGGFLVHTKDGDIITKDDDNKDLLYHNDAFDTSFTSFQVTEGSITKEYIFGSNYSFLGLGENDLKVTREDKGIKAVWTADDLTFTQVLEPVASASFNEHGTVKITYSVHNGKGEAISVKARLLMDTALGKQDYAYYELAKPDYEGGGYNRIEKEQVLSTENGDYIPANFFAYDNYTNPTITAYTIRDESDSDLWPYKIAFGHWNNLASTVFDFTPDGDLTFTNFYNKEYLTADSAFAQYYNPGEVAAGSEKSLFSAYYGVDSKARVADSDAVGITITSPGSLTMNENKKDYLLENGVFKITTNITNLAREGAQKLEKVAIAVLLDDGFLVSNSTGTATTSTDNLYPYYIMLEDLDVGAVKQLDWWLYPQVASETRYRKIVFRAYKVGSEGDPLLLDNLIGSSTMNILCPGGNGDMPGITFTGASPQMVYDQGTRHIYLTGTGFNLLTAKENYQLKAYLKSDRRKSFTIPAANILFPPDQPGVVDIVLKDTMPAGDYELIFEWYWPLWGIPQSLTAPALSFTVTTDEAYRNDYYGIVAVVKRGSGESVKYEIKTFADEKEFKAFEGDVLLVFRGGFSVTSEQDGVVLACSAVSNSRKDTININGALDFENGNVQIYKDTSGSTDYLMVEFNGDLYTTNSRTAVWSGNASLTPLNDGTDYGLIKYDERGSHISGRQPQNVISLVWPSGYNMLQTIGGLAVDFRYGQFGAMYKAADDEKPSGYVVSFGGKLDLSFLIPGGSKEAEELDRKQQQSSQPKSTTNRQNGPGTMLYSDIDGYSPSEEAKEENEKNKVQPVGKINIEDVLFGNNKGYIGINSQVELMLPKYIEPLPAMGGKLSINTIGGYAVGVLGKVKTVKLELEFELKVKNAPDSGEPVPDKIYFYMSGFEPGVNIDSAGAVWITGAGGGIDKLYDTIFKKGGTPPLTLLLSASFDIMKVMSGRSDLELSLRGFQIQMRDIKLKNTDKVVINRGTLTTRWDPDFYLAISALMDIYGVIGGNAYLVVDSDDFFEFFLRANVNVPKDVKIVGGMTVGNVDLGGNNDKVWGVLAALGIKLGITYYWGSDDVHFGTGAQTVKPTYPELLGAVEVPGVVNAENGKKLYIKVGTNVSEGLTAQLVEDLDAGGLKLMSADPTLISDTEKKIHRVNLGDDNGADYALTMRFTGDGRPKTIDEALPAISVSRPGGSPYVLNFYNGSNPDEANANLVDEDGVTAVSMTITDYIAGDWNITTTQGADLTLYTIGAIPEVTSFTADLNESSGKLDLTWQGTALDETRLSFYVTTDIGGADPADAGSMGTFIGSIGGTNADGSPRTLPAASGQSSSFELPANLPSGHYYVRMISSKEEEVNQSIVAAKDGESFAFNHVNSEQPGIPGSVSLQNCGNNRLKLNIGTSPTGSFDGYQVSIYENTGKGLVPTDFTDIPFERDEEGNIPELMLGGKYFAYSTADGAASSMTYGLTGGKNYVAKVAAYKMLDSGTPEDTSDDLLLAGAEAESNQVVLKEETPPVITFEAQPGTYKTLAKTVATGEDTQVTLSIDTFTTKNVNVELKSDVPVTGYWSIDGTLSQDLLDPAGTGLHEVADVTEVPINQELCDGEHTITFSGSDADGDSFLFSKIIAVDTMPPRLMLTSPTNGSFFSEDGKLLIEGLGDKDALYTIAVDGQTRVENKTLAELGVTPDSWGLFSYEMTVDPQVSAHTVRITAADLAGNSVTATAAVKNGGFANIKSVELYKDDQVFSNKNIVLSGAGDTTTDLQLRAITASGRQFIVNDRNLVQWTAHATEGSASISADGRLTVSSGSIGFAEGSLRVSESASMSGALTFGAEVYSSAKYPLTVASTGGGTAAGSGAYTSGEVVTITATPAAGYKFDHWITLNGGSFGDASAAVTTFTMPGSDTDVMAYFLEEPEPEYELSIICSPAEGGTASYDGDGTYTGGAVVAITAIPATGYKFDHWSTSNGGSFGNASAAVTTFTMPDNDTTVTAYFAEEVKPEYELTMACSPAEGGTASGGGTYVMGEEVTVTATPTAGYKFDHWSTSNGGSFGNASAMATTFTMPGNDTAVTAHFTVETSEPETEYNLTMASDPAAGGTASYAGDGTYTSGEAVTITATLTAGYKFDHWSTSNGGSFGNAAAMTTTFIMSGNDTTVTAHFKAEAGVPEASDDNQPDTRENHRSGNHNTTQPTAAGQQYFSQQGELASIPLTSSMADSPDTVVPYYMSGVREIIVPVSRVADGRLIFVAPASAVYFVKQIRTAFTDTRNHWAKADIDFAAARGLNGTGNQLFDPDGKMTRAMFTAVIARLDGADLTRYGSSTFTDIPAGSWYGSSVEWAVKAGVIKGTGAAEFSPEAPVTREQMAVMLYNYLLYKGYVLKTVEENPMPYSDDASISSWALEAMEKMRGYGILSGKPGNIGDPQGNATRAECSAVFKRIIEAILAQ